MRQAEYYWISHRRAEHLPHSPATVPRGAKNLLPDHYSSEIAPRPRAEGFDVAVLRYRAWFELCPGVRGMCMDKMNQDGMLPIRAGASLIVNLNNSPLFAESVFIRRIVHRFPRKKRICSRYRRSMRICSISSMRRVVRWPALPANVSAA